MSSGVSLGYQPEPCLVHLTKGSSFAQELRTRDGSDWPDDAVITITFDTDPVTVWTASLNGPSAMFSESVDAVAAIGYGLRRGARTDYSDGDGNTVNWFVEGQVIWHG